MLYPSRYFGGLEGEGRGERVFQGLLSASTAPSTHADLDVATSQLTCHYCHSQVRLRGGVWLCHLHTSHMDPRAMEVLHDDYYIEYDIQDVGCPLADIQAVIYQCRHRG